MNSNRIDPLAPPPPKAEEPKAPWWRPWAIRLGASILGAALGASCPLWGPAAPICVAVSRVVQAASSVPLVPAPPAKQEE